MTDTSNSTDPTPSEVTSAEVPLAAVQPRGSARLIASIVLVVVIAAVAIFAIALMDDDTSAQGRLVGDIVPPVAGITMTGDEFDIDQHRGEWVVVNFFATWCPPCIIEHPELVTFAERNAGRATVVSIAFEDSAEDIEEFFLEHGGNWPVFTEDIDRASVSFGVVALPESFIVDPTGQVVAKITGGVTAVELEDKIVELEES